MKTVKEKRLATIFWIFTIAPILLGIFLFFTSKLWTFYNTQYHHLLNQWMTTSEQLIAHIIYFFLLVIVKLFFDFLSHTTWQGKTQQEEKILPYLPVIIAILLLGVQVCLYL